jgi:hypothetical protein
MPQEDEKMKRNNHLTQTEEKTLESLIENLKGLQDALSTHAMPLTPKERCKMLKMGEKTLAFVKKCYEFSKEKPELSPKFFNQDEFEADYNDATSLNIAIHMAAQLHKTLVDIQMTAGSGAFQNALFYYNSVKMAVIKKVNGADLVYAELRKRFPNRKAYKPSEETPSQPKEQAG